MEVSDSRNIENAHDLVRGSTVRDAPTVESPRVLPNGSSHTGFRHRRESRHFSASIWSAVRAIAGQVTKSTLFSPGSKIPIRWTMVFLAPRLPTPAIRDGKHRPGDCTFRDF
jgi:hypothetical protein